MTRESPTYTPTLEVQAREIVKDVAKIHGVSTEDIYAHTRHPNHCVARRYAMQLVKDLGLSFPQVGRIFNRDHSTVVHACKKDKRTRRVAKASRRSR